jgi:hypothetical protein
MNLLTTLGIASMVFVVGFTYAQAVRAPGEGQSPRSAIIEAWFNIVIGFSINYVANLLIIPLAIEGGTLTHAGNFWMGWVFTTVSIVRQFVIRRWFNAKLHAAAKSLARA